MSAYEGMQCCGLLEYDGLNWCDEVDAVAELYRDAHMNSMGDLGHARFPAHIVLSEVTQGSKSNFEFYSGRPLVRLIRKHSLGRVVGLPAKRNPNSGNYVRAWLWSPHVTNVKKFVEQNCSNQVARIRQVIEDERAFNARWRAW